MIEDRRIKELESYGEVDYLTDGKKISLIESKFEKATIDGSAFSNELRILNNKYGMYQNISNVWQLCEIEENKDTIYSGYYKIKHIEELTIDKLFEIVKNEEIKKYYEAKLEEYYNQNRIYYEFDVNLKKSYRNETRYIHFYVEVLGKYFEINIDSNQYVEFLSKDFEIYNDYGDLKETFDELVNKEIIKYVGKDIIKLENGYVYQNTYYEDFNEIKEIIEEELKGSDKE